MPITPQSILSSRQLPTVATGPIVATGTYAVGQMVTIVFPGGNLSAPQIIGGAAGSAPVVRQVVV